MRAVLGQVCAAVAQGAAHAQFAHRVGADHPLKAIQVFSQRSSLARNSPRALRCFNAAQDVFDNAEQIGPCSGCGIERNDIGIGKTQGFAEAVNEQLVNQTHLGADHFDRGVISTGVLAEIGIVNSEEIFVKIEPGIFGASERVGRHHSEHAHEHIEGSGHVGVRVGIRQNAQCARQQVVLYIEGAYRAFNGERVGPLAAA